MSRHVWLAAAAAVWLTSTVLAAAIHAAPALVDFDDLTGDASAVEAVTDQYAASHGVRFNGPRALDYSQSSSNEPMPEFPRSGTNAVEPCYAQEFCTTPVRMTFDVPQARVQTWVGYATRLPEAVVVELTGVDEQGKVVADRVVLGPSEGPIPIRTSLEVSTATNEIVEARVGLAGRQVDTGLALDDIAFERLVPALQLSADRIDYGNVEIQTEKSYRLTVTSTGSRPVAIGAVDLDGSDRGIFTVSDDGCSQQSLSPGETCRLRLRFEPAEARPHTATLTLHSNAPDSPATVTLTATGIPGGPSSVEVPNLVGLNLQQARNVLQSAQLVLAALPENGDDTDTVGHQDPAAGTVVEPGTAVQVRLEPKTLPDRLMGLISQAAATLPWPWSLVVLGTVALGAIGLVARGTTRWVRRYQQRRWVDRHVRAVSLPADSQVTVVSEPDGQTSNTLRLVRHLDADTQIREKVKP